MSVARIPAVLVVLGSAALAAACGSSSGAGPGQPPASSTSPSSASPSTPTDGATSGSASTSACSVVTAAMLAHHLGSITDAGTSSNGFGGGSTCSYKAIDGSTHTNISVQTTSQPDTYLPASIYAPDSASQALAGVDRGYVNTSQAAHGNGLIMLVTHGTGVLITIHQPQSFSGTGAVALAAAIAAKL